MSMPTLHIASPFSASLPAPEPQGGANPSNASSPLMAGDTADDLTGPGIAPRPLSPHILPPGASAAMDLVANIPALTDGSRAPLKTVTEEYGHGADALADTDTDPSPLTSPATLFIQPKVA